MCKFLSINLFNGCKTGEKVHANKELLAKYQSISPNYNGCSCTKPNQLYLQLKVTPCDQEGCPKCAKLEDIRKDIVDSNGIRGVVDPGLMRKLVETGCVPPHLEVPNNGFHQEKFQ